MNGTDHWWIEILFVWIWYGNVLVVLFLFFEFLYSLHIILLV